MRDVAFVAVVIAFFALANAYVRMCNWVIGRDGPPSSLESDDSRTTTDAAVVL